ncbi:hypothetical protein L198_02910 [Cryptococcus wingfieldii CBS 7118]|uniref:Uncharacterized protein n=1 Tax=Cryptococcus wingfieldii CBS 7118 TaxID=1295528 RepID=A0A1E3JI95_9TREE|nr:hypothetical protein L198_02910 [Cryptococcus wingfieldii CBS 7118]ODO00590.1 hypothetical protein L198_02910 [Cryptococcus wingfieldii CBS 7118]
MSQFTEQIWTVISNDEEENTNPSFACHPQSTRRARPISLTKHNLRSLGSISCLEDNTNTILLSASRYDPTTNTLSRTSLTAVRSDKRIPMTEFQVSVDAMSQVDGLLSRKLEEPGGEGDAWLVSCFQGENTKALLEKEEALFSELRDGDGGVSVVGEGRVQLVRAESPDAVKQLWEQALEFEKRESCYDEDSEASEDSD